MERTASLLSFSSRSSSDASTNRNDPLLPYAESLLEKKSARGQSVIGRGLYRRILIWTVVSMIIVSIALFKTGDGIVPGSRFAQPSETPSVAKPLPAQPTIIGNEDGGPVLVIVDKDKGNGKTDGGKTESGEVKKPADEAKKPEGDGNKDGEKAEQEKGKDGQQKQVPIDDKDELSAQEDAEAQKKWDEDLKKMPWLKFPPLNGYFHGLKALVAKSDHTPEYPNPAHQAPLGEPPLSQDIPTPKLYNPYSSDSAVEACYLDKNNTIPAPNIYAYEGVPQYMPDPAIGSHSIFGIRDDVCFDRFGRYGPYGLGYKLVDGGSDVGIDTESSGSETVWEQTGQINYGQIDWADVQDRCATANKHRFADPDPDTDSLKIAEGKKGRIAVVIRLYTGFKWTQLVVLNFRAMINELALRSGGEYHIHFLLHVKDNDLPIWSDDVAVQLLLDANVPPSSTDW
ncbi:hypothetical protein TrVFT333_005690 [Trichoderma virens FT-333]|nr:hypothetical protein TrVFT333_005690 [Trichoderma virens FT-333]